MGETPDFHSSSDSYRMKSVGDSRVIESHEKTLPNIALRFFLVNFAGLLRVAVKY